MWDNHEFSWLGWQSFQKFQGTTRPAQTRKVAANQAWFEYQPARIRSPHHSHWITLTHRA
jgi:alkaline phosphatase D